MTAEFCRSEARLCWVRVKEEHARGRRGEAKIWLVRAIDWERKAKEAGKGKL